MLSLHICVGALPCLLGAWMLYSRMLREAVEPVSRQNAIISQTRPEGNVTLLHELVEQLPDAEDSTSDFDILVWGEPCNRSNGEVKELGSELIVARDSPGKASIFANKVIPQEVSLRQLVKSKGMEVMITDPFQFRVWMEAMLRTTKPSVGMSGRYRYSFRDYWNFEESRALEIARGSIRMLELRMRQVGELTINDDGSCRHLSRYWINALVPMDIQWHGHLEEDTIVWDRTVMYKGWSFLKKMIDRPTLPEKFRRDPWIVRVPLGEEHDKASDILVLERQGHGRLVYVKESAL